MNFKQLIILAFIISPILTLADDQILSNNLEKTVEEARELRKSYNYDEALDLFYTVINSLEVPKDEKERLIKAKAYNEISVIFRDLKFFNDALDYNQRAIDLSKENPSRLAIYHIFRGNCYFNMAEEGVEEKNLNQLARENYSEALKIYNKTNAERNNASLKNLIANSYLQAGDLENAEKWALEGKKEGVDFNEKIIANQYLSRIYADQGKYEDVIKLGLASLSIIDQHKINHSKAGFHFTLYESYKELSRLSEALYHHEQFEKINSENIVPEVDFANVTNTKTNNRLREKAKELESQVHQSKKRAKNANKVNYALLSFLVAVSITGFYIIRNKQVKEQNLRLRLIQKEQQAEIDSINAMMDGRESERKEIGRFLHDHVSALLNTANIQLEVLANEIDIKNNEKLGKAQFILDDIADKVRNLSHKLLSNVLQKYGLSVALEDLCSQFTSTSIRFEFHSDLPEGKRYQDNIENKVYGIVQELFNNILKHSKATEAELYIEEMESSLYIKVTDNGVGFQESDIQKGGIGLHEVKTRIKGIGGKIKINSDELTTIEIYIPLAVANIYSKTHKMIS